jgi:hypothetical protein
MNKLLKDAIADAKAVRETALANAKLALEEAFQPRLERMFSEKIKSEMADDMEEDMIPADDEVRPVGEGESEDGMARMKELAGLNEFGDDDFGGDDYGDDEDDFNMDFEEEPGAAKAAQADMKGEFSDDEDEDNWDDEGDDFGDDEDLEEIIRQLEEDEMMGDTEDEMPKEAMKKKYMEEDTDLSEELDEEIDLDEVIAALREDDDMDADDMENESVNEMMDQPADFMQMLPGIMAIVGSGAAAIGARELINNKLSKLSNSEDPKVAERAKKVIAFFNGLASQGGSGGMKETAEVSQELEEAYSVIEHLREKINEVNLLNAKLLYVNKVFKKHSLSESQKLRVVESFDRATTVRETKLIYTTLSESLATKPATKNKVMEGFASSPVKKTQILTESNTIVNRFQKLAGINNQD